MRRQGNYNVLAFAGAPNSDGAGSQTTTVAAEARTSTMKTAARTNDTGLAGSWFSSQTAYRSKVGIDRPMTRNRFKRALAAVAAKRDPAATAPRVAKTGAARKLRVPQDYPTIQAALDAAGENANVLVAPGTYVENLIIVRGVTLRAADADNKPIIRSDNGDGTIMITTDHERVVLRSLDVKNDFANYSETGVITSYDTMLVIRNCDIEVDEAVSDPFGAGAVDTAVISIGGSALIKKCNLRGWVFAAAVLGTNDAKITNSVLQGNYGSVFMLDDDKTRVSRNDLRALEPCWSPNVIGIIGSANFKITDNNFGDFTAPISHLGIFSRPSEDSGRAVTDGSISGNSFFGDATDYSSRCGHTPAPPLFVFLTGTRGLRIRKNIVRNSIAGFWFFDWNGPQEDIELVDNTIEVVERGDSAILAIDVHKSRVADNRISNKASATSTIALIRCSKNLIHENTVTGISKGAFYLENSSGNSITENECEFTRVSFADCFCDIGSSNNSIIRNEFGSLEVVSTTLGGVVCEGRDNTFKCNEFGDGYPGWSSGFGWYLLGENSSGNAIRRCHGEIVPSDQIRDLSGLNVWGPGVRDDDNDADRQAARGKSKALA